jgi:hypothetical protein
MKLKNKLYNLIFLLILFFTYCKYYIKSEIKLTDLYQLVSKNFTGSKFIDSEIKFEVSNLEKCNEDKEGLEKILSEHFNNLKDLECKKDSETTYLHAKFQLPMVKLVNGQYEVADSLFNLTVNMNKTIRVGLYLDKEEFNQFNKSLSEKYSQIFSLDNLTLSFSLVNDSKKDVNLKLFSIYSEDKAYPKSSITTLTAGSKFDFYLSNILKDYILQESFGEFLIIEKIKVKEKD